MAARIQTRSKNATTRPALPVIQLNEELDNDRKAEHESKKQKAATKRQQKQHILAKKLENLEQNIADEDAINDTPRAVRPKAQNPTHSKPHHDCEDTVMPNLKASGAEEHSDGKGETDVPTTKDEPSEQEWTNSKVSTSDSEVTQDDSEASCDVPPPKKRAPRDTKKQSAHTAMAVKKPTKQKKSIQDALDQEPELCTDDGKDVVDATPRPKARPKARPIVKEKPPMQAEGNAKRGRNDEVSAPVQTDGS